MTGDQSPCEESVIMGDIEGIVTLIIGIAGVLCIPVLVWVTVIAGLYQIVRDKVRETRPVQTELAQSAVANKLERN
jgi:hypothetical protein